MAKRGKSIQFRNHSLITYCDEDFVLDVLNSHAHQIKAFAYCYHDKDIDEDGKPKEPHIHILILCFNPYAPSTVKNWFACFDEDNKPINTLYQQLYNVNSAYRYLLHMDDPDKFQYDICTRICSDTKYFERGVVDEDVAKLALFDMLEGVPLKVIAMRYGRDFIYHYGHLKQVYDDIVKEGL